MSTPKLVATDLDGTLVRADGSVSDFTRDVLVKLEEIGVPVIFVTGRPLRWTRELFEHIGSVGLAIVSNGALVWDVATDKPRLTRLIEPALTAEVAATLTATLPGLVFATESLEGWSCEPEFATHTSDALRPARRVAAIEELADEPLIKLLARRHDDDDADELLAAATAAVGDRVNVTHSSFPLLEISAPGVTKASTLELVCTELGISDADVIAFGDMPNDLPMLTWAGTSYAMADAHPSVVACASHLAPGHEDDGVARVLAGVFGL
ncbi:Cof-type HAD-IIB family hydrolase [Nocardioides luteus]|uniref:Haloacid dehalogenase n=1 Tax=Nocardioides luteus TaxID=1844 RepID=A0A1J4N2I3_9ACTN|nr:Cof-type HAD-IIB family hydrolase [Nocardioides luteus]OIJ25789.1 haloacid dehalogenase [Nocardioides luteus]